MTGARGFDLLGPLPEGTTVLEASAGTGKTYAIVGLAARFVAEGGVDLSAAVAGDVQPGGHAGAAGTRP